MTLQAALAAVADPAAFARGLSDADAIGIARALLAERQGGRYAEIAATFPAVDADTWPIDYAPVLEWRRRTLEAVEAERLSASAIRAWYRNRPHEFIEHWGTTYDPRNAGSVLPVKMPMLLFKRQREFVTFIAECLASRVNGLGEKTRDFGLTWLCVFIAVWLWSTWDDGPAIGFGSRKEDLVDKIGDASSIFEKIRMAIRGLPPFLLPIGFSEDNLSFMKCINPETGAAITGESGDSVGRGGRTLIYFKDEAAHYARPDLIEAALSDNTNVQIDISTPNGLGNVFHRRREAGKVWLPGEPVERGRAAVFIADWRDHPAKDQAWYDERKQKAIDEGLLHVFKQEVDRDYAASVEGVIIPAEWVKSAIDAHVELAHLGDWHGGPWLMGLDVADGGGDTNALTGFKGSVLRLAEHWGEADTGKTTRRAVDACERLGGEAELQYDCIGIGAGVKAEANRLEEDGLMPARLRLVPWNAGAAVQNPSQPLFPDDRDSPTNAAMFYNFKAQAWWNVRLRFERTHRAMTEGLVYDPADLISLDSTLPLLRQIEKELSQPTAVHNSRRQLLVDKKPDGTKSPNLGDAIIMAANPALPLSHVYAIAAPEFSVDPFAVPSYWPRGFALMVEPETAWALFAAYEKEADVLYFTTEHVGIRKSVAENAGAILSRGGPPEVGNRGWIPGTLESDETNLEARAHMLAVYGGQGLTNLMLADRSFDAGIAEMDERLKTGRLKVFSTCQEFFRAYRSYRRDEKGEIIGGGGIMNCARMLSQGMAIRRMVKKPTTELRRVEVGFGAPSHGGDRKIGY